MVHVVHICGQLMCDSIGIYISGIIPYIRYYILRVEDRQLWYLHIYICRYISILVLGVMPSPTHVIQADDYNVPSSAEYSPVCRRRSCDWSCSLSLVFLGLVKAIHTCLLVTLTIGVYRKIKYEDSFELIGELLVITQ